MGLSNLNQIAKGSIIGGMPGIPEAAGGWNIYNEMIGKPNAAKRAAQQRQEQLQRDDLAFREQQMQDAKDFSDPLQNDLKGQVDQAGPLDYEQMKGQINNQFGMAGQQVNDALARKGLSGGYWGGQTRSQILDTGVALTNAFQQGITNKRKLAMTLLGHDQRMQAASLLGDGYQNSAGLYGSYAAQQGQAAQQGYGAAASAIGNGLYLASTGQGGGSNPPPATGTGW